MPQTYKGLTIPADLDTADAVTAFANFVDSIATALVPTGIIWLWPMAAPPAGGWLLCQGQSLATTGTYANLFAVLGYTYGGSGAAFLLPNLAGRVPVGLGGSWTPGFVWGADTINLVKAQMPAHNHAAATGNDTPDHTHGVTATYNVFGATGVQGGGAGAGNIALTTGGASARHTHSIPTEGSGANVDIRQKSLGMGFIIKI